MEMLKDQDKEPHWKFLFIGKETKKAERLWTGQRSHLAFKREKAWNMKSLFCACMGACTHVCRYVSLLGGSGMILINLEESKHQYCQVTYNWRHNPKYEQPSAQWLPARKRGPSGSAWCCLKHQHRNGQSDSQKRWATQRVSVGLALLLSLEPMFHATFPCPWQGLAPPQSQFQMHKWPKSFSSRIKTEKKIKTE